MYVSKEKFDEIKAKYIWISWRLSGRIVTSIWGAATQCGRRTRACWCISGVDVTSEIVSTGTSRHFCCRAVLDRRRML